MQSSVSAVTDCPLFASRTGPIQAKGTACVNIIGGYAKMNAILVLIDNIVDIYIFTLLAYVIASWLVAFRIVNPWQPFVRVILQGLGRLHEPLLGRIRSVLPDLGGIDISPIIVLLVMQFGRNLLFEYLR